MFFGEIDENDKRFTEDIEQEIEITKNIIPVVNKFWICKKNIHKQLDLNNINHAAIMGK